MGGWVSRFVPTYLEDEYVYEFPDEGVRLTLERFREERGEVKARCIPENAQGSGFLPSDTINIGSARSQKIYANTLKDDDTIAGKLPWTAMISEVCRDAERRYREGAPSVPLAKVEWRQKARFVVEPWVDAHGTTILFGDGGTSKSLHALALAVSIATGRPVIGNYPAVQGPVLYCDWEADEETHAERLEAICEGVGIEKPDEVHYMQRAASIGESAREIRKAAAQLGAVLVVVDSLGAAGGGDPEKADTVIRSMNAIRSIAIPTLAITHVTKEQKDKTKPFGSVYAHNLARRTVRIDRDQEEEAAEITVKLTTMKANFGMLERARGHRIQFENGDDHRLKTVRFEEAGWGDLPQRSSDASAKYDIAYAMREAKQPMAVQAIVEITGLKADTVRKTLRRNTEWFSSGRNGWSLSAGQDTDSVPQDMSRSNGTALHGSPLGATRADPAEVGMEGSPF